MILKILHHKNKDEAYNELILEADSFLIVREGQGLEPSMCYVNADDEINPIPWITSHKDTTYSFDKAYLTNKEGKTVQKYG